MNMQTWRAVKRRSVVTLRKLITEGRTGELNRESTSSTATKLLLMTELNRGSTTSTTFVNESWVGLVTLTQLETAFDVVVKPRRRLLHTGCVKSVDKEIMIYTIPNLFRRL